MLSQLRAGIIRVDQQQDVTATHMTGRNDACPCGSGKKYKKCHGLTGESVAAVAANGTAASTLLEQCRRLYEQKQFAAAWSLALQLPKSAQTCRVQVDILVARRETDDLDQALVIIGQWKKLAPADPEPWSRLLEIALNKGDKPAQQTALKKLQSLAPSNPRTLFYQALLAQIDGQLELALELLTESARRQFADYNPASWKVLAASRAFDTASGKYPGSGESSNARLLGEPAVVAALKSSLHHWDAVCARVAHSLETAERSSIANAWQKLTIAGMQGLIDLEACQAFNEKALALNPDLLSARSSEMFCLNYDGSLSVEQVFQRHLAIGDWMARKFPERKRRFLNARVADRPLKVAYLSSDFCHHPVSYFILPVLRAHRPGQVRSYLYYNQQKQDEVTAQCVATADQFLSVWDYDDQALASQMERDGIDILVDLNGASSGNRLTLLAQRAAPVQITWLGYPNTTGLPTVDYRIVDNITDPKPHAASLSREKLFYLPRLFSVYDPICDLPPLTPAPCESNGYVTFGSFNNINKLTRTQLALWAELLHRVPDARLLFKYPTLEFQNLREELLALMNAFGVASGRIRFLGLVPDRIEHLNAFSSIDIHLDSFPYHGTTTSCESLVMSTPLVTLAGDDHRSRVGASLLHSVGHGEWVARTPEDYLRIAAGLAGDIPALAAIRTLLRSEVQASALMDANTFTAELEAAYRDCWANWCRQNGLVAVPRP